MIVLRNKSFAKKNDKSTAIAGATGVAGAGALLGSSKLIEKGNKHLVDKVMKSDIEKIADNSKVKEELLGKAKSQGIKVVKDPKFANSAYIGMDTAKLGRKGLAKLAKSKSNTSKQIAKQAIRQLDSQGMSGFGKDQITLGQVGPNNSAIIAHELGHAQHTKGRTKDVVGKLAHKLHAPSNLAVTAVNSGGVVGKFGNGALAAGGFRRGKNSVSTDENGKIHVNGKKALKSATIGAAISAPLLIAEGAASTKGLKMMKKAGASKQLMEAAKRDLGNAFGTYATMAAKPIASELGGHGLGVSYGIIREKQNKKK